jgi:hypothetical protein
MTATLPQDWKARLKDDSDEQNGRGRGGSRGRPLPRSNQASFITGTELVDGGLTAALTCRWKQNNPSKTCDHCCWLAECVVTGVTQNALIVTLD